MRQDDTILKIDGIDFEKMVRNGLANLSLHIDEVNAMNVFPVPDGDTGNNMFLTLKNAIDQTRSDRDIDAYLEELSRKMLMGARGNSGVILSQLFRGLAERLNGKDVADAGDLRMALTAAYRAAYASVQHPVEGTMLTVAREGIEKLRNQIRDNMPIPQLFSYYVAEMRKSLSYTPLLLQSLKEAGVVDSGGLGYILIVEGMLKALYGIDIAMQDLDMALPAGTASSEKAQFNADASFTFGYCMEFLLQLLKERTDIEAFPQNAFADALSPLGDSIAIVRSDDRIKVHIHTKEPAPVIVLAQQYGEFVSFKLENMHLQHSQFAQKKRKAHVPLAVLAVCNGTGITGLYREFDYCSIIDGGESMSVSCQDFINAFERIDADEIVVLPNNKNIVSAARQAVEISGRKNISILPSLNVVQGYLALSMDIPSETLETRRKMLQQNMEDACVLCFARAMRTCKIHGQDCEKGDYLAFHNGSVLGYHADAGKLLKQVLAESELELSPEYMQIFIGEHMDRHTLEQFQSTLKNDYPNAEIEYIDSGHPIYDLIISVT